MKRIILALCAASLASCVTSGDLQRITDQVGKLESVALDANSTAEDLAAAVEETKDEIASVAEDVEERTEGLGEGLLNGTQGGLVGIGSAIAMYLIRESTRKKALATVVASKPPAG